MAEQEQQRHEQGQQQAQQQEQQSATVKIVLTANNYLGRDTSGQRRREERLQRLRDAFQQATNFAVVQGADLFIQAGNLFDTTSPDERDRAFVASCLARLKQAGIPVVALGGTHDTYDTYDNPVATTSGDNTSFTSPSSSSPTTPYLSQVPPAPQRSYAQLGALHYFAPLAPEEEREPFFLDIHNQRVGLTGAGWHDAHPFDHADVERASRTSSAGLSFLIMHVPVEGISDTNTLTSHATSREMGIVIKREEIAQQKVTRIILDGYAQHYQRMRIGETDVISAGSTQADTAVTVGSAEITHTGATNEGVATNQVLEPGFVYLGVATDGTGAIRWCNHIPVDALLARQVTIQLEELWSQSNVGDTSDASGARVSNNVPAAREEMSKDAKDAPTSFILQRLEPLCNPETMLRLRLEGSITRRQYHQLDLNRIRHYGEQHCFSLAIDDSSVTLLPDHYDTHDYNLYSSATHATRSQEREAFCSLRQEVIALADRWIADAEHAHSDEQERRMLQYVKEDVLAAMDKMSKRKHA